MKVFLVILASLLAAPVLAQKQEISVSVVGNFNPTYYVELWDGTNQITGGNADTVGGSAEYRYCFAEHWCAGPLYEQNKTDGVLWAPDGLGGGTYYRWLLMRYEALAMLTAREPISSRWALDVQAGAGFIVTNGYSNSGWSEDFAVATGASVEYALRPRWSLISGERLLNTAQGCYGDSSTPGATYCAQRRSLVQDVQTGFAFKF